MVGTNYCLNVLFELQKTNTLDGVKSYNRFYIVKGENNLTIGSVKTCRLVWFYSSIDCNRKYDYY